MSQPPGPLDRLLNPASVAIVGLSSDAAKHGGRVLGHLRRLGFAGQVWGINPRLPNVPGVEMFPSLLSLPSSPDAVVCAVPAAAVGGVVAEASQVGAGVVVVFAGGFSESGEEGQRLQSELVAAASAGAVRVLGPNSGGVIRPAAGVAFSFLTCLDRPVDQIRSGPVALVTQSGGTGSYLHNLAAARGSGFAASISTGNEADLGAADAIEALIDLPDVVAIAVVLETVRRGPEFMAALRRARQSGRPVIVCRLGRSERGRRLMVSHTGALAGPARVLDGVLEAEGVTIAATPSDLLDIAEVMARAGKPTGERVGVVSHSGGIAILLSDLAEAAAMNLPTPGPDLRENLTPLLELGSADNPLDMGGIIGGPHRFAQVVEAFARSEDYDMVLAVSTAHPPSHTMIRAQGLVDLEAAKPVIHLWMAGDLGTDGLQLLRAANAAVTEEPRAAMTALAGLCRLSAAPDLTVENVAIDPISQRIAAADRVPNGPMSEHAAKKLLSDSGILVVEGGLATTDDEAVEIATAIGFPVVVKVSSVDVPHKTEVDGIRLGIGDEASLRAAFAEVVAAGRRVPGAVVEGARVESHVSGLEMIVGAVRDATFGPMVLVGLGGVLTEVLGDVVLGPAPITLNGARRLLFRLQGKKALTTARHGKVPEIDALAAIIVKVAEILVGSEFEEIEINPLIWTGSHWLAADALVRAGPGRS